MPPSARRSIVGVRRFVLLEFMTRENGARFPERVPGSQIMDRLEAELHDLSARHRALEVRVNRYSAANDRYVVVEPDGSVVLCSETADDRVHGNLLVDRSALHSALKLQQLNHRTPIVPLKTQAAMGGR